MRDSRCTWADEPDPADQPAHCPDCGGTGHLRLDASEVERWNSGVRYVAKRHAWQLVTCKACRGTGRKRGVVVKGKDVSLEEFYYGEPLWHPVDVTVKLKGCHSSLREPSPVEDPAETCESCGNFERGSGDGYGICHCKCILMSPDHEPCADWFAF